MNKNLHESNLSLLKNKNVLIIIPELANYMYYIYLLSIIEYAALNNATINVTLSKHIKVGIFQKARFGFTWRKYWSARRIFINYIEKNYNIRTLNNYEKRINTLINFSSFKKKIGNSSKDILSFSNEYKLLNNSLHSSFVTDMANSADSNYPTKKYKKRLYEYYLDFENSYNVIQNITAGETIDLVIFFNGRATIQAGVREFCEGKELQWLSLEHGSVPGKKFRLDPYQDQERIRNQNNYSNFLRQCTIAQKLELSTMGESWLVAQENERSQNYFIREKIESELYLEKIPRPFVNIFTSSVDENISSAGWDDEDLQGFINKTVQLSTKLKSEGIEPVIIMHPNSLNKSWRDLSLQLENYKKHNILTISPWAQISSYDFFRKAYLNITWRSTLGLEISGNGLPCFVFGDTFYDLLTDVKRIDFENLNKFVFEKWKVDSSKSLEYIGYLYNYGIECSFSNSNILNSNNLIKSLEKHIPLGSKMISVKNKLRILKPLINPSKSTPANLLNLLSKLLGRKIAIKLIRIVSSCVSAFLNR